MSSKVSIKYIKHSSFLLEFDNYYILFDYYLDDELTLDKPVYILCSHFHQDHFSFGIFNIKSSKRVFILANDIKRKYSKSYFLKNSVDFYDDIIFMGANEFKEVIDIKITTLKSNDSGVAFIVSNSIFNIYFSGDLHYWLFDSYDEEDKMLERKYFEEIEKIKGHQFDIAFIPLDIRLKNNYRLGMDYFMSKCDSNIIIPMHCFGNYQGFINISNDKPNYYDKLRFLNEKNIEFIYTK